MKQETAYVSHDGRPECESTFGHLKDISAEQMIEVNSMFTSLTAESKFVLYAIFNTPGELSKILLGSKPKASNIRRYLKCMGWEQRYINNTLTELKRFTKELFS